MLAETLSSAAQAMPDYAGEAPIVIITGASGFLGGYVAERLARLGFRVVPVARRNMPWAVEVEDYRNSPRGDVLIHLAEEPNRSKVNQLGENYILQSVELVRDLVARFGRDTIYISSGVVYGDQNDSPCRIDAQVYGMDVYCRAKLLNEKIIMDAGGCVVRLSNLFGAGNAGNNVLYDITRQVPGDGPLTIRDYLPVRDFLSVSDAARAIGMIVQDDFRGMVNVGSGIGTSVHALVELALAHAGQEHRVIVATAPSSRRSMNVLDISETRKMLGWVPDAPLQRLSEFMVKRQASL